MNSVGVNFLYICFPMKIHFEDRNFSTQENVFYDKVGSKHLKGLDKFYFIIAIYFVQNFIVLDIVAHTLELHHHYIIRLV